MYYFLLLKYCVQNKLTFFDFRVGLFNFQDCLEECVFLIPELLKENTFVTNARLYQFIILCFSAKSCSQKMFISQDKSLKTSRNI